MSTEGVNYKSYSSTNGRDNVWVGSVNEAGIASHGSNTITASIDTNPSAARIESAVYGNVNHTTPIVGPVVNQGTSGNPACRRLPRAMWSILLPIITAPPQRPDSRSPPVSRNRWRSRVRQTLSLPMRWVPQGHKHCLHGVRRHYDDQLWWRHHRLYSPGQVQTQ